MRSPETILFDLYRDCIILARFLSIGLGLHTSQRYSSGMLFLSSPMQTTCCQTLPKRTIILHRLCDNKIKYLNCNQNSN